MLMRDCLSANYQYLYSGMKIPFRTKVLLFYQKILNRGFYTTPLVKITDSGKGVKSVLFFLPPERDAAQVVAHFIKRSKSNASLDFKFVTHQDSLPFYDNISNSDFITYTENDVNWFGAIKTNAVLDRIGHQSFDALVDLNQSFNQCLSLLSLQLKIPIKIGFQSPIADDLYSVVIQPVENSFLERSYQVVEMILGMHSE